MRDGRLRRTVWDCSYTYTYTYTDTDTDTAGGRNLLVREVARFVYTG